MFHLILLIHLVHWQLQSRRGNLFGRTCSTKSFPIFLRHTLSTKYFLDPNFSESKIFNQKFYYFKTKFFTKMFLLTPNFGWDPKNLTKKETWLVFKSYTIRKEFQLKLSIGMTEWLQIKWRWYKNEEDFKNEDDIKDEKDINNED